MAGAETDRRVLAIVAASIFFATLGVSVIATNLNVLVAFAYCIASVVTFFAYLLDKSAAIKGRRRKSENTLHLLALVFGWPGALVAQQVFRHKTVKKPFRLVFWVTVLLNLIFFVWLHTPEARAIVDGLIALYRELTADYRLVMPSLS